MLISFLLFVSFVSTPSDRHNISSIKAARLPINSLLVFRRPCRREFRSTFLPAVSRKQRDTSSSSPCPSRLFFLFLCSFLLPPYIARPWKQTRESGYILPLYRCLWLPLLGSISRETPLPSQSSLIQTSLFPTSISNCFLSIIFSMSLVDT